MTHCIQFPKIIPVLVPYGVSIFLFRRLVRYNYNIIKKFSSPMGYLYFYSKLNLSIIHRYIGSRPLWGIYISIHLIAMLVSIREVFSSPMGYLYFYSRKPYMLQRKITVLVPYGVSIFLFGKEC